MVSCVLRLSARDDAQLDFTHESCGLLLPTRPSKGTAMTSTIPSIQVGEQSGYLFESTVAGGLCFVPQDFVQIDEDGRVAIDESQYVVSGWARKNVRFNLGIAGARLFPNPAAIRHDVDTPEIAAFLNRLRWAESVRLGSSLRTKTPAAATSN